MLPLHIIELPHLHSTAVALALRGGPRYEPQDAGGQTHFLEHMLFRGAGDLSFRALMAAFEEVGGEPDAYTSEDTLVIHLEEVDPAALERALELLAAVLLRPRYESLESERQVILEEAEDPSQDLDDLERRLAFGSHPLGRLIIGSQKAVRRAQVSDLEAWRKQLVVAGNAALCVAGPVDPARVRAAAAPLEDLPDGAALAEGKAPPSPARRIDAVDAEGERTEVRLAFRGPGEGDPLGFAALQVVVDLLDGGPAGRLPTQLVDEGLAYEASAGLFSLPDLSLLELDLACTRRRAPEALETLLGVARRLHEGVGADELERGRMRRRHLRRALRDDAPAQAEWAVRRLLFGLPTDRDAELARADAVSEEQAVALAQELLTPGNMVAAALAPSRKAARRVRDLLKAW